MFTSFVTAASLATAFTAWVGAGTTATGSVVGFFTSSATFSATGDLVEADFVATLESFTDSLASVGNPGVTRCSIAVPK